MPAARKISFPLRVTVLPFSVGCASTIGWSSAPGVRARCGQLAVLGPARLGQPPPTVLVLTSSVYAADARSSAAHAVWKSSQRRRDTPVQTCPFVSPAPQTQV